LTLQSFNTIQKSKLTNPKQAKKQEVEPAKEAPLMVAVRGVCPWKRANRMTFFLSTNDFLFEQE